MSTDVGKKIKELRTNNSMTLKDLSEKTGLSTGFLSQLERGLTTIAIDSLQNIAEELNVDLSYFFTTQKNQDEIILRSYERQLSEIINPQFIHFHLSNDLSNKDLLPRLIEIFPMERTEVIKGYPHKGEEFVYVLEGVLTLIIDNQEHIMYPGDSAHYVSSTMHNWANYTNKTLKILSVHTPNSFKEVK